jgi:PEP-CTERM motif
MRLMLSLFSLLLLLPASASAGTLTDGFFDVPIFRPPFSPPQLQVSGGDFRIDAVFTSLDFINFPGSCLPGATCSSLTWGAIGNDGPVGSVFVHGNQFSAGGDCLPPDPRCTGNFFQLHGSVTATAPLFGDTAPGGTTIGFGIGTISGDFAAFTQPGPPGTPVLFNGDTQIEHVLFSGEGRADITYFRGAGENWGIQAIRVELNPVPEPGTLLLVGSSLVGVGTATWRRRRMCSDVRR